ncbi:MAG: prolipoprotein diacylglyceryl transferase [Myxococcota bacterium]
MSEAVNCFVWNVDPEIFSLGPLKFRWYGLMFAVMFLLGYRLLAWQFERGEHKKDTAMRFLIYIFVGMLIGAYFGHRIFYEWDAFISNPLSALDIRGGIRGLASHGASVGIIAAAYIFHRKTKIRFLELMDRMTMGGTLATIFVRVGNLFNSEIVGRKSEVAWAFCFPRADRGALIPRHPSQIYEAIIGVFVLGAMFLIDKRAGEEKRPLGLLFGSFLVIYFSLRFFVEFFKEYQTLPTSSPLTMGQFLSIPFVAYGVGVIIWSLKTRLPAGIPPKEKGKKRKG